RCRGLRTNRTTHTQSVDAITVPVTDVDLVTGPAEGHHSVSVPATQGVVHVVGRAAANREAVLTITVPVTDEHLVLGLAIGKGDICRATVEHVAHVVDLAAADRESVGAVTV